MQQSKTRRAGWRRGWLVSAFRVTALVYGGLLTLLVLMESRLVYPGAYDTSRPVVEMAGVQAWRYPADDGSMLTGRLYDPPEASRVVLFLHGNGLKVGHLDAWILRLGQRLDARVLAAEYRGFERPDRTPTEAGLIADSLSAHDALCEHYDIAPSELIVFGRSLGGGCAAAVAAERATRTLVLDRTFDSVVRVAEGRFPVFPVRWLMRNRYDSIARLGEYRGRLFQIHGPSDTIVPYDHGRALFDSVPSGGKVFVEVPDLGHMDPLPDAVLDRLDRWLSEPAA